MRGLRCAGLVLLVAALACGGPSTLSVPSAPLPTSDAATVADYTVHYDGKGELLIEGVIDGARSSGVLAVESGAEAYVSGFESAPVGSPQPLAWSPGGRSGRAFVATACRSARCRVRYRYALREAARQLDDLDIASEEGDVLEAPASTWLLAPQPAPGFARARVRFHVLTAEGTRFVTGIFRGSRSSTEEQSDAPSWEISLADLWTAPYSAFGPLRVRRLDVGARVELAIGPGKLAVTDEELAAWAGAAARAIRGYFGRFPMPEALILVLPSRGRWVGFGKTLSGGGGAIVVRMGERATTRALAEDWVLVHEMVHLTFPSVAREHDWAEEGLATYVEPFARARAGMISAEGAWHGLADGLPNGLPRAGDRGLDRTPTWGRTYWGGALFYLLADVEIRKRTDGRLGLEHALRGVLDAGGSNAQRWPLDDVFAAGDRATGVPVLRELHDAMGTSPHPVDLDELLGELGVVRAGDTVRLDDAAPLAAVRRAMTPAPRPGAAD